MEPSKSVGPDTSLVFLGIEIDSVRSELRLPMENSHICKIRSHNGKEARLAGSGSYYLLLAPSPTLAR